MIKKNFNQVEDKLITLSKNLTCIICLTNQVQILTIPCGHLIMCNPCSLNLVCPLGFPPGNLWCKLKRRKMS